MKLDRQLRPATETSWVVSYVVKQFRDGGRPPFWKSIYHHISVKNHRILMKFCTQQQILNWVNITWSKNEKVALDRLRVRQNVFLVSTETVVASILIFITSAKERLCDQCGLSVIRSSCLSVSRITAKVISRFHGNLVLWLGLPVGRTY